MPCLLVSQSTDFTGIADQRLERTHRVGATRFLTAPKCGILRINSTACTLMVG